MKHAKKHQAKSKNCHNEDSENDFHRQQRKRTKRRHRPHHAGQHRRRVEEDILGDTNWKSEALWTHYEGFFR